MRAQAAEPRQDPHAHAHAPRRAAPARMAPGAREEMILEGAVHFFARHGFKARTRDLSRELGVSQALIYRYFGSKTELIERVYERNFMARWKDEWGTILGDRAMPLRERLTRFYVSYLDTIDSHDWIRISVHSGLDGNALTRRYIQDQVETLLGIIAREAAIEAGEADAAGADPVVAHERVWHLHSTFIYYLYRKHVFRTRIISDTARLARIAVDSFMGGLRAPPPDSPEER